MSEEPEVPQFEPPWTPPIDLVGGVNFSTWPDLKWSRGNSHVSLLQSRFAEWQASAPVSIDVLLSEDRCGVHLVARVPKGIPKHDWSLDLGDALHNIRSAFDAAAWGMAHFNEARPKRAKSVYFPICTDEFQWQRAVREWVGDIPEELQERIRLLQPFTYTAPGSFSLLTMLHDLDIQDKHRDVLTVSADIDAINLNGSMEYENCDPQVAPRLEMLNNIKFGDGVVLGTIHAGAPIRLINRMILRPAIKMQLVYRDATFDVIPLLHDILRETRRYLSILLSGVALQGEPDVKDPRYEAAASE